MTIKVVPPVVLSRDIINEPRCEGCEADLQKWIDKMLAYAKSLKPQSMVRAAMLSRGIQNSTGTHAQSSLGLTPR
jgi:hypothetical protein